MLSACLIVKDGASTLPACLQSLAGLAHEIVVVIDPRTRDNSRQIAEKFAARIFERTFDNFSSQKNYAVSKASGPWILALDADEMISPKLKNEILQTLPTTRFDGFKIPRLNRIFGRDIYHTNWGPADDSHIWLFKKSKGRWVGIIHEEVVVKGAVGQLINYKLHQSYRTVSEFMEKLNYYTSFSIGSNFSFFMMWKVAIYDFLRRYFWHTGFKDGLHGFFLSYLMLIYHLTVYIKKWQKKSYLSS